MRMITLSFLFTILGFWACYQTSRRVALAVLNRRPESGQSNQTRVLPFGLIGLLVGFVLCVLSYGLWSGLFVFLILLTIVSSLMILLAPLGYISGRNIAVVALLSALIEITL
ncbi:hypothetical protein [Marinoscillum luteum]|uniref:DUF3325 domain-containing protein n=1 Tax=Marinoscillum luteum TaxID=861051 RepID=A0ABW7N8C4_9BACT